MYLHILMLPLRKYPALRGIFLLTRLFFKYAILCRSKRVKFELYKTSFLKKVETCLFFVLADKKQRAAETLSGLKILTVQAKFPGSPSREICRCTQEAKRTVQKTVRAAGMSCVGSNPTICVLC